MASVIITSPYRAWYMLALLGCLVPTGLAQTLAPSFQGYEIIPGSEFSIKPYWCSRHESWSTTGSYAACCESGGACGFYSGCSSGTMTDIHGGLDYCPTDVPNCAMVVVHDKYPIITSTWTKAHCDVSTGVIATLYREIITSSSSFSTSQSSNPTTTSAPTTPASTQPPLPTPPTVTEAPQAQSSPPAWIAGPIAGGVVGIVAIGYIFFWLGKRKAHKKRENAERVAFIPEPYRGYPAAGPQELDPNSGDFVQKNTPLVNTPGPPPPPQWGHQSWGQTYTAELPVPERR